MTLPYPLSRRAATATVRERPGELNLVGVRTRNGTPDAVDDVLYALWRDVPGGPWLARSYPLETEPSSDYLRKPLNPAGTAIMADGYYPLAYTTGLHRGRPALVQIRAVSVYRDNNRNATIELDPSSVQAGLFAINIHDIQGDLAGCQGVPAGVFPDLLALCRSHVERYGPLDYTLINDK